MDCTFHGCFYFQPLPAKTRASLVESSVASPGMPILVWIVYRVRYSLLSDSFHVFFSSLPLSLSIFLSSYRFSSLFYLLLFFPSFISNHSVFFLRTNGDHAELISETKSDPPLFLPLYYLIYFFLFYFLFFSG